MLENLLPPGVFAVEGPILTSDWDATPEELARAAAQMPHRRAEFLTGRTYARRALRALGIEAETIGSHPDRSPIWPGGPDGAVGCISHTKGYCGVVAAKASPQPGGYRSLGLDIETPGRISEAVGLKAFTEAERAYLATVPEELRRERMCAIFCAKEAFYKLQFPITKAWVGFQDVEVRLEGEERFEMGLLKTADREFTKGRTFTGRYLISEAICAASMAI